MDSFLSPDSCAKILSSGHCLYIFLSKWKRRWWHHISYYSGSLLKRVKRCKETVRYKWVLVVTEPINIAVNYFDIKKSARCSRVLVVTELVVSSTRCNFKVYLSLVRRDFLLLPKYIVKLSTASREVLNLRTVLQRQGPFSLTLKVEILLWFMTSLHSFRCDQMLLTEFDVAVCINGQETSFIESGALGE